MTTQGRKLAVRLHQLDRAVANDWAGELRFLLDFSDVSGPAAVGDGRQLSGTLTAAELAQVLEAVPATRLSIPDLMALVRIADMLRGKTSRFTGIRVDDLRIVLAVADLAGDAPLSARDRTALKRAREAAGGDA